MRLSGKPKKEGVVFSTYIGELGGTLSLRSLDTVIDKEMMVNWVNQPYSRKFWQMDGSAENWLRTYIAILDDESMHAFVGCFNDEPICQIDAYVIAASELNDHISAHDNDAGLHLLMGPPREMQKGFAFYALKCFQQYYFSFPRSGDLYAEPDQQNYHANRMAMSTGFQLLKTVELSDKIANLYKITREQFSNQ
jgi:RimJ/RimL family protein N-acetyltransferase